MSDNDHYPALIYYIEPELYKKIEKKREKILYFTNTEVLKGEGFTFDFRYNPKRKAIGFFVKKGSVEELVLHESDVEEKFRGVFEKVKRRILTEIDSLNIRQEIWK